MKIINGVKYNNVWADEFDIGSTYDSDVWFVRGWGDDGITTWKDDSSVCSINNGHLTMTMTKDGDTIYTQEPLTTVESMSFMYGYAEIRAKLPSADGSWPAWWIRSREAIGTNETNLYDIEVDIVEVFGDELTANMHRFYQDTYNDGKIYNNGEDITEQIKSNGVVNNFAGPYVSTSWRTEGVGVTTFNPDVYHIFGFLWTPEKIECSIDGVVYATIDLTKSFDGYNDTTGFHQPAYFVFSNHLIGDFGESMANRDFVIDYIRLYQADDGVSQLYTK